MRRRHSKLTRKYGRFIFPVANKLLSSIASMSANETKLASRCGVRKVSTLAIKARVVEWQTRTFEGRMPKGMRVQVPPRAPNRAIKLLTRPAIARIGFYRLRTRLAFPRNHWPWRQETLCPPNSKDQLGTTGWRAHDSQDRAFDS